LGVVAPPTTEARPFTHARKIILAMRFWSTLPKSTRGKAKKQ
jgi:hypothetical protein